MKINSFTKICLLITSIFLFSCKQPANPPEEPHAPGTISPEQINANIKKSGIAKDVELPTTIQNVSYKLILSASSGKFTGTKNERAAKTSYSGSFFYKDSYVFINIEDDSSFLKIFVDKVIDEMNKQAVKNKSEIEDTALVIPSNKTSTSITSDDYKNAKTSFNEKVEDYLTGLTEDEPPAEEPPVENPPAEEPPTENPPEELPIDSSTQYLLLKKLGFTDISTVTTEYDENLYNPKSGDIIEFFLAFNGDDEYTYTLNRKESTTTRHVYNYTYYNNIYKDPPETEDACTIIELDVKNKILYTTMITPENERTNDEWYTEYVRYDEQNNYFLSCTAGFGVYWDGIISDYDFYNMENYTIDDEYGTRDYHASDTPYYVAKKVIYNYTTGYSYQINVDNKILRFPIDVWGNDEKHQLYLQVKEEASLRTPEIIKKYTVPGDIEDYVSDGDKIERCSNSLLCGLAGGHYMNIKFKLEK